MSSVTRKLKYAIVGVAGVGQHHCRFASSHDDLEVVALVDPNLEAIEQSLNVNTFDRKAVVCYESHMDMIDGLTDSQIDAVSISTPHAFLFDIAKDCLEKGLHVLIEKPLAMRLSEAEHLVALAQEKNVSLAVAYQYRTFDTPRRLKNVINSGVLGNLNRVLWTWFEFRPQSYYSRDAWRATWAKAGGGLLMNQISHELDLIRWLFGEPQEVSAVLSNQFGRCELDDIASISMTYKNGLVVTIQASLNQPHSHAVKQVVGENGALFIQQSARSATNSNDDIEFYCYPPLRDSAKTLQDDHAQPSAVVASNAQRLAVGLPVKRTWLKKARRIAASTPRMRKLVGLFRSVKIGTSIDSSPVSGHAKFLDDFVSSILNKHTPLVSGEDAAKTLQLINAIVMSAVQKRSICLPFNSAEYDDVLDSLISGDTVIETADSNNSHDPQDSHER